MSAFVVGPETMDQVVRLILKGGLARTFAGCFIDSGEAKTADEIGRKLFAVNVEAVCQRYPDCRVDPSNMPGIEGAHELPANYRFSGNFKPLSRADRIRAHKALKCLIYQCSEGDVTETPGYAEMERLAADNAEAIVNELPEYKSAEWG